jgi:hypothetical protein
LHELYHLLVTARRKPSSIPGEAVDEELESAADSSTRVLIPPRFAPQLSDLTTAAAAEALADAIGVAPDVVGRMQHQELIPHSRWPS